MAAWVVVAADMASRKKIRLWTFCVSVMPKVKFPKRNSKKEVRHLRNLKTNKCSDDVQVFLKKRGQTSFFYCVDLLASKAVNSSVISLLYPFFLIPCLLSDYYIAYDIWLAAKILTKGDVSWALRVAAGMFHE